MLLAIDWATGGIKALQFIFSFSIIVTLHELGHFLTARMFGCRVEKFYLFFNPWFSLWKKKIGDTEYGIGWLPLGGYVKIAGMIDESMDKEQMKKPPQPWEFRSKPAWQRLIIMVAGVVVNLILGFIIYAMILWHWGEEYVPVDKMTYGIYTDSLSQSIGFKDGDKIVSIDGKYQDKLNKVQLGVILHGAKTIEVDRNGEKVAINIPKDFAATLINYKDVDFISLRIPFVRVDSVLSDTSVAARAGLRKGDRILAVNDQDVPYFNDFRKLLRKNIEKSVTLSVLRGNDTIPLALTVPKDGVIGFSHVPLDSVFQMKKISYSFAGSFPAGFKRSYETLESYWLQLKLLFSPKVKTSESLGGIISIGRMFSPTWDWQSLWYLTAFFSLILALMNILPIPALDGGHALFCIFEMITGRKPSEKFMEVAVTVGMILLLGLMVYALGLDVWRIFTGK